MTEFDKEFDKSRKRFDFTRCLAVSFIGLVSVCMIIYWGFLGFIAVKAFNTLSEADPKEVASELGEIVKSFNKALEK